MAPARSERAQKMAAFGALTIWQLYLVGFVNGTMTVFFDVADQLFKDIFHRDHSG